jgi:hypothetical protein
MQQNKTLSYLQCQNSLLNFDDWPETPGENRQRPAGENWRHHRLTAVSLGVRTIEDERAADIAAFMHHSLMEYQAALSSSIAGHD